MAIIPPNIRVIRNTKYILCVIRRKWIIMTPEEKVRQFILHQLIHDFNYPQKYISVEKMLKVNDLSKRYDIVIYNQALEPRILIECKAEYIEIKEKTLQQIATYNITLQVPYLMVTNGYVNHRFEIDGNTSKAIDRFPPFESL
jgi:hypothetical protein